MKVESVWAGKRGHYWIEVADAEDGSVIATAIGPAPGAVGQVARATAATKDEAIRATIARLEQMGA